VSESFKVGEIAVLCNATILAEYNGQECQVIGPLTTRAARSLSTGGTVYLFGYRVVVADGKTLAVEPQQLRKRRPPQDWKAICNLTDAPRELETA
jgi:hypothetical protein